MHTLKGDINCGSGRMNANGGKSILWTEEGGMTYFNISPLILQQLQIAHEFNHVMFDVVKFLAPGYAALLRPLNPGAKPWTHRQDLGSKNYETEENQQRQKHAKPDVQHNE